MEEENSNALIMGKIDVSKLRSAFFRLVVSVLGQGYTIDEVVDTRTKDVFEKKVDWVKTLENEINDYIMHDEGRITKKYFFGPYKNQSDCNKPIPVDGLMRSLYTQLHKQGVTMLEVKRLCSPVEAKIKVEPSEAAHERLRMILEQPDA